MSVLALFALVVFLSLLFTYTNGFQDGSSVGACAIASRAMTPLQAVLVSATCEFLGALFGGSAVSQTIHGITSWPEDPTLLPVLASGLFSAILWNFITKILKVPSSSTHALVGGVFGALLAAGGSFRFISWGKLDLLQSTGVFKILVSLFISPLLGFIAGYLCFSLTILALLNCTPLVNKPLKASQWFLVPVVAFAHGANDTQKAMGIILLALASAGLTHSHEIPLWVRIASGSAMSLGVASLVPGIVMRVGAGIYKLRPVHAFAAQFSSAAVILTGSLTGGPVSASQVIASAVMGVGTADRKKGVHWLIARDLLFAWFFTIPCSALLAILVYVSFFHYLNRLIGGTIY